MFWNDRQQLDRIAQAIRAIGWILAALILVVGSVTAASGDGHFALLLRVLFAAAVLALASAVGWLIDRYAQRAATR